MDLQNFLHENKKENLDNAAKLAGDNRKDDAIMATIRANVFDIFIQAFEIRGKLLGRLKAAWTTALTLANQHGDTEAAAIEEIKLAVLSEIEKEVRRHDNG